jgi:hypothetical protein
MANYIYWNQALVIYFTSTASYSKRVYLSADDEILEQIGQNFSQEIAVEQSEFYAILYGKMTILSGSQLKQ